jgi:hypothetical protein
LIRWKIGKKLLAKKWAVKRPGRRKDRKLEREDHRDAGRVEGMKKHAELMEIGEGKESERRICFCVCVFSVGKYTCVWCVCGV